VESALDLALGLGRFIVLFKGIEGDIADYFYPSSASFPCSIFINFNTARLSRADNHNLGPSVEQEVELIQRELVVPVASPDRAISKNPNIMGVAFPVHGYASEVDAIDLDHVLHQKLTLTSKLYHFRQVTNALDNRVRLELL